MKIAFALGFGLCMCLCLAATAQDKKDAALKLEGKYTLTAGTVKGNKIDDAAKKGSYTFTADKITIEAMGIKFVMSYKLDTKTKPAHIDMEILEGPEGTKGTKAQGIVEKTGDVLKLAYSTDKDKRPKDFTGKDGFSFELKKTR